MKLFTLPLLLLFILAACTPSQSTSVQPTPASNVVVAPTPTDNPALIPSLFPNVEANTDLARTDEQGMVVFQVTPLNLGTPADTLEFSVAMNTHSIDLSMDLAALSTLATDTGLTLQATKWDAIPGGHHVSGKLLFPAMKDGKSILEGANKLTLTIVKVDADSRIFEWDLK